MDNWFDSIVMVTVRGLVIMFCVLFFAGCGDEKYCYEVEGDCTAVSVNASGTGSSADSAGNVPTNSDNTEEDNDINNDYDYGNTY